MSTTSMTKDEYGFSQNTACSPGKGLFSLQGAGGGGIQILLLRRKENNQENPSLLPLPCTPSGR